VESIHVIARRGIFPPSEVTSDDNKSTISSKTSCNINSANIINYHNTNNNISNTSTSSPISIAVDSKVQYHALGLGDVSSSKVRNLIVEYNSIHNITYNTNSSSSATTSTGIASASSSMEHTNFASLADKLKNHQSHVKDDNHEDEIKYQQQAKTELMEKLKLYLHDSVINYIIMNRLYGIAE